MRFSFALKASTFLLALASALPTALSGEVGIGAIAAAALLGFAGLWIEPPLAQLPRYRKVILGAAGALLAVQVSRALSGAPGARMALEFALVLLGLKLCSRARFADYQQIAALGFLNIIGATITTFDLVYAAGFLSFVLLSPVVLSLSHLRGEMEKRFHNDGSEEGKAALERLFASRRVVSPAFLFGVSALSLPVLAITAVLFLSFPRLGLGFFGRAPASPSVVGMTNEVRIGDLDAERDEGSVVARLEPVGPPPHGGWPNRLPIKLRGAAFDTYDGALWKRRDAGAWEKLRRVGDLFRLEPTESRGAEDGAAFDVLLESLDPPYLFVPLGTGTIRTEPVVRQGRFQHRTIDVNALGMLRYDDDAKVGIRYRVVVTGAPLPGEGGGDPAYLSLPAGTERLVAAARGLVENGDDGRKIARIVTWLQRGRSYGPPTGGAENHHAIDRFLFEERRGTCEHFATSAALMLRAVGVRTRFVTGFGSAEFNPIGGYYAVRTKSAHAWVEAFVDGSWTTVEATPPAPPGSTGAGPSTLALFLDAARMRWHKYVIGFDINTQMKLGSWLMEKRRSGTFERISIPWRLVGLVALVAIAAVAGFRLARAKRGRKAVSGGRGRRAASREIAEASAVYRALDGKLAALGFARPANATPLEHLAALPEGGVVAACAARVTARYNDVRFGADRFAPGERERLHREIRGLRDGR